MNLTTEQLAYLAGFIDGDGYIGCQKQMQKHGATPFYKTRIAFTNTTREPLQTIAIWLGIRAPRCYPPQTENRSPRWRLDIPSTKTCELLRLCLPFFILKCRQAEVILEIEKVRATHTPSKQHFGKPHFQRMPTEAIEQMEILYQELRTLRCNKRPGRFRKPR